MDKAVCCSAVLAGIYMVLTRGSSRRLRAPPRDGFYDCGELFWTSRRSYGLKRAGFPLAFLKIWGAHSCVLEGTGVFEELSRSRVNWVDGSFSLYYLWI